jgi:hypothetical protein
MIDADFVETARLNGYRAEPMAFHCLACKTQLGWYRQGGVIVMGVLLWCRGVELRQVAVLPANRLGMARMVIRRRNQASSQALLFGNASPGILDRFRSKRTAL